VLLQEIKKILRLRRRENRKEIIKRYKKWKKIRRNEYIKFKNEQKKYI
jgi:hypothetical protein